MKERMPARRQRRSIAVFDNYADAERAVDRLSDLRFPVGQVAIIGDDLQMVEQVTGRLNYGGAAQKGAASGALPGALIGWLFGLFNLINPLVASIVLAFYGLIFGAVIGAVLGLVMHALQRGRRDFDAVAMMVPRRFEVVVDEEVAEEAALLRSAIQTSAPINPGNSGGALVNLNSEVIGIPTLAAVNPVVGGTAPGIGFAIPSDTATDLASQIITHGRVVNSRRAALGVSVSTVTDLSGKPVGVGISGVVPSGPAANAGLENGDVIIKVGDTEVTTAQQLQEVLAMHKPGDTVRITFIRPPGGATTVTVTLSELPAT